MVYDHGRDETVSEEQGEKRATVPRHLRPPGAEGDGQMPAPPAARSFFAQMVEGFADHVERSVPLYTVGHALVCRISDFFVPAASSSVCYELGTSTSALLAKLARRHQNKHQVRWVGIDFIPEMVEEGRKRIADLDNVELVVDDILTYAYEPSDFVVAYLTVHFVPPRVRQRLIDRIYETLKEGGGFVLFEKVRAPEARLERMMTTVYHAFKLDQGFTPEEIANKARRLEGILVPYTTKENLALLRRAGFPDVATILKYATFECFLAVK